jgi:oxepin-CoA hydrolase / 3-oxo-5,6-dehydrosuberyl-CoA semialdehyde dehydrogenase
MHTLQSYSSGRWHDGVGELRPLLDAATGDVVARIPALGPDSASMLSYARNVGGPAIGSMTFTERAAALKGLARYLWGRLDEFVALSTCTGATRRDTAVDVDGGIGTVAIYASVGSRELPDSLVLVDGGIDVLGKGGSFAGQHIFVPRAGVSVQINAFNFPVWGMLEKFAPAFLAGMPSVVKPASQTAYLTEAVVRAIVESELLPAGSLSLLCGGPGDLLDYLGPQDTVGFTGSASTAHGLRIHPAIAGQAVAFNAEADSLNCSILGPDVSLTDPEFGLYVDQLVTEMTVKAGQKCTAIRRAFVPLHLADAVADAVSASLATAVVGHPADSETTVGPLASLAQRDEVRRAVAALSHEAQLVFGDVDNVSVVGADAAVGAFISPILLRAEGVDSQTPHQVEAFGPVSTLLPYDGIAEVIGAAALGAGSLVGSIVSRDPETVDALISGLSPWHGRLLVLDRDDAADSTGHGVAMPQMQHGGPGRAGGGSELGGLRALHHYMQRTAIQGHPDLLARLAAGAGEES